MNLKEVKTCDLVKELSKREGVEKTIIEPYQKVVLDSNETGPMIILKIVD